MKIAISGKPKEIVDFVSEMQNRQKPSTVDYGLIEHLDKVLKHRGSPCPTGDPGEKGMPILERRVEHE